MSKQYLIHRPRRAGKTSERIQQLVVENLRLQTALGALLESTAPYETSGADWLVYRCKACGCEVSWTNKPEDIEHAHDCAWVVAQEELAKYGIKSRREGSV